MIQIAAARKPDGIDFVGNSKISSFRQNPPPTALLWYLYTRRRRAAFRRAESNARMARLRRDTLVGGSLAQPNEGCGDRTRNCHPLWINAKREPESHRNRSN